MTTNTASYPTAFPPIGPCSSDPVRSRVHVEPQLTHFEMLQADAARRSSGVRLGEVPLYPPETDSPRPRRPHMGDVVYWVTCVCGVGLLLFAGTR